MMNALESAEEPVLSVIIVNYNGKRFLSRPWIGKPALMNSVKS